MTKTIIEVQKFPIRLGQFLKLANVVSDGNEAKFLIGTGTILVNGQVETRRGKKLYPGDTVEIENIIFICSAHR